WLNSEIDGSRTHISVGGLDRFLHDVAQVAGHGHLALARHHHAFHGEQLAADLGPGKARHHADLVLELGLAVPEFWYAEIVFEVLGRDLDRLLLAGEKLLDGFPRDLGDLALEITHAMLARVAPDDLLQGIFLEAPLLGLWAVGLGLGGGGGRAGEL